MLKYLSGIACVLIACSVLMAKISLPEPGGSGRVPVFGTYGLSFTVDHVYTNPYDPEEVAVDATITQPDRTAAGGKTQVMPCFWMVPVREKKRMPEKATWCLRYTPTEEGEYSVTIRLKDKAGRQEEAVTRFVAVKAADPRGFLRPDPWNGQFLRFGNGQPYYPLGMNVGAGKWPGVLTWTRRWIFTGFDEGLEWTKGQDPWSDYEGLGRYSQVGAASIDAEVAECERNGRYMQMVFWNHQQVLEGEGTDDKFDGVKQWNDRGSPYWSGNGGPVEKAADWHTNPEAKKYQKRMIRYIVARWSYSTHILGWELFNETDYSSTVRAGKMKELAAWHDEMSRYLKGIDPYQHLVLTSISNPYWGQMVEALEGCDELDMIQNHLYDDNVRDRQVAVADRFRRMKKPTWMAEYGMDKPERDITGRHIRRGYWLGMMNAQPAMYWYPEAQQDRFWPMFKTLRTFMEGVDVVRETGGEPRNFAVLGQKAIGGEMRFGPTITHYGGEPKSNHYTIRRNGTMENLDQLPRYVEGLEKPGRNHELVFRTEFPKAATLSIELIGGREQGQDHEQESVMAEVQVNREPAIEVTLHGKATTQVELAPGAQVVTIRTRQKGIEVGRITVKGEREPLVALGYAGRAAAMGYVHDATLEDFTPDEGAAHAGAVLVVSGLDAGSYTVELVDPKTGKSDELKDLKSDGAELRVPLPTFHGDIAFRVYRGK